MKNLTTVETVKTMIKEEETKYLIALKKNKNYALLKGQRILIQELKKELNAILAKMNIELSQG